MNSKNTDKLKIVDVPQLSNEMQLSIMFKVKSGELSIDDALNQARMDKLQQTMAVEEQDTTLYNFSVYKFNRYRWQKRVLQIDFSTKTVCSIEKGIVKRQLSFADVKNCHDGPGTKFSISFKGRHDYELEATSVQDKQRMMLLINKVIHGNIYSHPVDKNEELYQSPPSPKTVQEGQLLLQRGGLASFRWKKYDAHLHMDQLTLLPVKGKTTAGEGDVSFSSALPLIIHLSDGNASVETMPGCDTFTLRSNNNEYQFRVPIADQYSSEAVQRKRDAWVQNLDNLCLDWKRKSQAEPVDAELKEWRRHNFQKRLEIVGDTQSDDDKELDELPETEKKLWNSTATAGANQKTHPLLKSITEVPKEVPVPTETPVMSQTNVPPPPPVPAPPPLPAKSRVISPSKKTKAVHWDAVALDKLEKSVWMQGITRKVEIDTLRLYEQFGVKGNEGYSAGESSCQTQIMLDQKIAHNFNIFLKSFPVQPKELKDKLFIVNEAEGGLSDEQIASLRRYVPTSDDVEMYKSYKGDVSELHVVDRYMLEMCNIPYLSTRLDLLLTLRELPISMEDLEPLIGQKIRMCQQLWSSKAFVSVLEYLLAMGNYLNENAGKKKTKGFRLSSLTKLSQLRGKDRKFTLMHALVEQIQLHEPHLATFFQELAEFETVPGASIKGLTAEVDVVKNELQKVIQYKKAYKKKNQVSDNPKFAKDLKLAIDKYNAGLSQLTRRCEEMRKLYTDILVKFGEPLDQDSQELFGWVCQFINEFRRVHAELSL